MSCCAGATGAVLVAMVVAGLLTPSAAPAQVPAPVPHHDGAGPPFTLELATDAGGGVGKPTVVRARLTRVLRDDTPLLFRVVLPEGVDLVAGFPEEKVMDANAHVVERVYVVRSRVAEPGPVRVSVTAASAAWGATATREYRWGVPAPRMEPPTVKAARVPAPGGGWTRGIPIQGEGNTGPPKR